MPGLVKPHGGGSLKPLMLAGEALAAERARAASLPKLRVSSREKGDLIMLGIGGFTPLAGFMTRADWDGVCDGYRTASGLFWPIPITLSADDVVADGIRTGAEIALMDPDGDDVLATMRVTEKFRIDKAHECMSVFRTTDSAHPGVQHVNHQVHGVDDVMRSYYFLRERGVRIVFGPGRHPTSGAVFLYFEGPDGMVYEYSTGVRLIQPQEEASYRPRQFPFAPESFCMWGSKPDIPEFRT